MAIEVEISRRLLDRVGIYALLGVPELWRFDGKRLRVCHLGKDGRYRQGDRSKALPMLSVRAVERFLALAASLDETTLIREFRAWVREQAKRR